MYKNVQERMSVGTKKDMLLYFCLGELLRFYFTFPTEYFWLYEKNQPISLFQGEESL